MRLFRVLFLPAILLVPSLVLAQGAFVSRGASGVLLGGEMVPDNGRNSYAAEAGYSFGGTFDVGLAHRWLEIDADTLGFQLSGRAYEPRLAFHLAKQGTTYPFSLSALGSYAFSKLDAAQADVDGRTLRVGGIIHSIVQLAEFVGFRPWGGILYAHRRHEYAFTETDERLEIKRGDTEYHLGAQIVFMPTVRSVFFIGPQVTFARGDRTVGYSAGLVFN